MNSYLVNYQFRGQHHAGRPINVGIYYGKTTSEAVKPLEKAGALIYSIILQGSN